MKTERLVPQLAEFVPANPAPGVLYVSTEYRTAVHACCCGCGRKVVTPLGPTDWRVRINGTAVSLYPSIGNWNFPCQSHYWIRDGGVIWAEQWTPAQIAAERRAEQRRNDTYYEAQRASTPVQRLPTHTRSLWNWLVRALLDFWR